MAMGHTEGKGKRVGRGHLSVRVPRWAALVEEPQGAHRPGRVFCPRRLVRGPGGRGGGGGAGLVGSGWTSGSPLIGSRQVANPNRSGGGTTAWVRPGTRLECSGGENHRSNRRSFAGAGAACPRLTRSAKLHRTQTHATAAGSPTGWASVAATARATGSGTSYAK